jgi:signal transduction histidine kinase
VPLRAAQTQGRLFWLDRRDFAADDLMFGQVVAGQVAPLLDQIILQRRLREAAVAHERVRLARDLHDGLLQSLAAMGIQLQVARDALGTQPEDAGRRLAEVQRALAEEQRGLRLFIRQMRPGSSAGDGPTAPLCARLRELAGRIAGEWGLAVRVEDDTLRTPLEPGLEQQTYLMVHEAVMNAARHARASAVRVSLAGRDDRLHLVVEDDGHGFPFRGRRDAEALAASGEGPVSLRERVTQLGGHLAVDSSDGGARVEIDIPLGSRRG